MARKPRAIASGLAGAAVLILSTILPNYFKSPVPLLVGALALSGILLWLATFWTSWIADQIAATAIMRGIVSFILICGLMIVVGYFAWPEPPGLEKGTHDINPIPPSLGFELGTLGQTDGKLEVNVGCDNVGPVVIRTTDCSASMIIHDGPMDSITDAVANKYFDDFVSNHTNSETLGICHGSINLKMNCWFSLYGPPIKQVGDALLKKKKTVLIVGRAFFAGDDRQPYTTEVCTMGIPIPGPRTPWVKCRVHNIDSLRVQK